MALTIPDNQRESINFLNELSVDDANELVSVFDGAPSTFSISHLTKYVIESGFNKVGPGTVSGIVELLVSLQYIKHDSYLNNNIDTFIGDVIDSAVSEISSETDWSGLSRNLKCFLEKDNAILITAKALNVMTDYEHTFRNARVLTDARHVFSDSEGDEKSLAVLVTHMLKIEHNNNGELDSIYIAMDSNDIAALQKTLERALRKESILKTTSKESGTAFLDAAYLE